MPMVSVLMPVYNTQAYLAEAVESILNQTFRDFEFIIIDDGSTDGSSEILNHFAAMDPRIRLRKTANAGVVSARNLGLEMALGELLAVMDSDDGADPRRLELQLDYMEQHPGVVAVGSYATMTDDEGSQLGLATVPLNHDEIEAAHLRGYDSIFNSAAMFRTEVARQAGGYRAGIMPGEDFDLWLRLGEYGRLANIPQPLLIWRRTLDGLTASNQQMRHTVVERILRDAWKRRELDGTPALPPFPAQSSSDCWRQWGWLALKNGRLRTARKYAIRALRRDPANIASWRLAFCTVRGR